MDIVTGNGKSRKVLVFPDASIVNRSPGNEQIDALKLLCNILHVPFDYGNGGTGAKAA